MVLIRKTLPVVHLLVQRSDRGVRLLQDTGEGLGDSYQRWHIVNRDLLNIANDETLYHI